MELRHLRYFVAVAEELHFGRAAKRLHISQPPLSAQIAALEEELGARLLDRSKRHVALTEAGRRFLAEARLALAQAEHAAAVAQRAQRGELGELRIGLYASAPLTVGVSEALAGFRAASPGVTLLLHELTSSEQLERLRSRALDLCFIRQNHAPSLAPEFAALEVVREPLLVLLPSGHRLAAEAGPLPIAALRAEPFVFFDRAMPSTLHAQVHALCAQAGFAPELVQGATSNAMIIGLVAAGFGFSILPAASCDIRSPRVVTRRLEAVGAMTSCWLVFRREAANPAAERFVGFMRQRETSLEG